MMGLLELAWVVDPSHIVRTFYLRTVALNALIDISRFRMGSQRPNSSRAWLMNNLLVAMI